MARAFSILMTTLMNSHKLQEHPVVRGLDPPANVRVNAMTIKVLMIHGTFASDATWVNASSVVSERVKTELARDVLVEPFRWSGHNTFAARHQAASNLVHLFESDAPETRYILIAHSHGGSVVHYAYKQAPALFDKVLGVACMATPFFSFSLRPGYAALFAAMSLALMVVLLHVVISIPMLWHREFHLNLGGSIWIPLSVSAAVMVFVFGAAIYLFKARRRIYSLLAAKTDLIFAYDTTTINVPRCVFFRSAGDEVALGLSAGQFLITVANRLLGGLALLADATLRKISSWTQHWIGKTVLVLLGLFVGLAAAMPAAIQGDLGLNAKDLLMFFWVLSGDPGCGIDEYPRLGFAVCVVFQIGFWLDMLAFSLTVLLLLGFFLGLLVNFLILRLFGVWSATAALAAEFAIEPTPEGFHQFCNTGWSRDAVALSVDRPGLQHSDPYSSKTAQDALSKWLCSIAVL